MDIKGLRSHKHFDELLFLLCNQDQPNAFRSQFKPTASHLPFRSQFTMPANDLARIYSCFAAAGIWVNAHCLWKNTLRPHREEDIAKTLLLISQWLKDAGLPSDDFLKNANSWMCDQSSPLYRYTVNELRFTMDESGVRHVVPLYGSDHVYLALMRTRKVDDRVKEAIISTLQRGKRFEMELLLYLPSYVKAIGSLVALDVVRDLAMAIGNECHRRRPKEWEELKEAKRTLLETQE